MTPLYITVEADHITNAIEMVVETPTTSFNKPEYVDETFEIEKLEVVES